MSSTLDEPTPPRVRQALVTDSPLSVDRLLGLVSGPQVGGIALFIGTIRDHDANADVTSLDYTQHPTAQAVLARCAARTAERHDVLTVAVEHRIGHLQVGDLAVVVAVGAVHRGPALAAASYLIDTLKAEVPIWKEQHFVSGATHWVGLPTSEADDPADGAAGTAAGTVELGAEPAAGERG
jgi:molybdopterin synthase catalytic subunit